MAQREVPENVLKDQMDLAVQLLMKCIPHLDLRVSEHNDGTRLRSDICMFLAGLGYPGWMASRGELWRALAQAPMDDSRQDCPGGPYYGKVRQG